MRQLLIILFLLIFFNQSYSQGCGMISGTKDKKTGVETKGGIVSTIDFYSLLVQKELNSSDTMNYFLFLNAASKIVLSDSLINSKGSFELLLLNGQILIIDSAKCKNNSLGFGSSIGFWVKTSQSVMDRIINAPIQKINVFGILETKFSIKNQKQLQKMLTCLKSE